MALHIIVGMGLDPNQLHIVTYIEATCTILYTFWNIRPNSLKLKLSLVHVYYVLIVHCAYTFIKGIVGGRPLSIRSHFVVSFGRFIRFGRVIFGASDGDEKLLSSGGKVQRSWKLRPTTGMYMYDN